MFKLYTPYNIQKKINLSKYYNKKLLNNINLLNKLKIKLLKSDYKDERIIKEILNLKKDSLFLFSQISTTIRDFRYGIYLLEKRNLKPKKEFLLLLIKMKYIILERAQLQRKIEFYHFYTTNLKQTEIVTTYKQYLKKDEIIKKDKDKFQITCLEFNFEERNRLKETLEENRKEILKVQTKNLRQKIKLETFQDYFEKIFKNSQPLSKIFSLSSIKLHLLSNELQDSLYKIFFSCWIQKNLNKDLEGKLEINIKRIENLYIKKIKNFHPVKLVLRFNSIGVQFTLHYHQRFNLIFSEIHIRSNNEIWQQEDPRLFCSLLSGHYEFPIENNNLRQDKYLAFSWIQNLAFEFLSPRLKIKYKLKMITFNQMEKMLEQRLNTMKILLKQIKCFQKKKFDSIVKNFFIRNSNSTINTFVHNNQIRKRFHDIANEKKIIYTCRYFAITFQYKNIYFQVIVQQPPGYPGKWPKIRCLFLNEKSRPSSFSDIKIDFSSTQSIHKAVRTLSNYDNSCKNIEISIRKGLFKILKNYSKCYILSIMLKKAQLYFEQHVEGITNLHLKKTRIFWGRDKDQDFVII